MECQSRKRGSLTRRGREWGRMLLKRPAPGWVAAGLFSSLGIISRAAGDGEQEGIRGGFKPGGDCSGTRSPPLHCALACRITAPCSTAFWQRGAVHRRLRRQRRRAFPPAGITRVEAVDRRPSRARRGSTRRCETNLPTHRDRRRAPGAWNQTVAPAIRWHSSPQRRQPSAQRFVSASAYLSHSSAHASQISAHAWLTCATKRDSRLQNPAHCQQMAAQSRQSRAHSAISGFPMQD
jgi:hypothetical protein